MSIQRELSCCLVSVSAMLSIMSPTTAHLPVSNAALICDPADREFSIAALSYLTHDGSVLLVSNEPQNLAGITSDHLLRFAHIGLETSPLNLVSIRHALLSELQKAGEKAKLLVDMSWGFSSVSAFANFDLWGVLCDYLSEESGKPVVSIYHRGMLTEDQLLAASRGHQQFLAPSGVYQNPFWLPPHQVQNTSLAQQIDSLLGRIMPDYPHQSVREDDNHSAASGANPEWIRPFRRLRPLQGVDVRWKIRCFGQLRIYTADGQQINWQIPGSSPKKTRALFAYLLQRGEQGASAERMAEFLWPKEDKEDTKRARLHHCITMLRKTLGHKEFLQRNGDYYQLIIPSGSWIDVANFEQLCRQSKILSSDGHTDDALVSLRAAERLYTGDLFDDLLPQYVESDMEDWCLPQRQWFREMALKVHRDLAWLLRQNRQYKEAMSSCRKALTMDPACEMAHAEAMQILYEQSRLDAVQRQYRQYLSAISTLGIHEPSPHIHKLYKKMTD